MINRFLAAASALLLSAAAHSATVYTDNFNSDTPGLNQTPAGWTLAAGGNDVDIVGAGTFFDPLQGNGLYVDLAGNISGVSPALLSNSFAVTSGTLYTVSFSLAGNQRDAVTDLVTVLFGGTSQVFTLTPTAGFTTYSFSTTATSSTLGLSFQDNRAGNIGALLDNVVVVSGVPEPSSVALMFAGMAALGFAARRRRN